MGHDNFEDITEYVKAWMPLPLSYNSQKSESDDFEPDDWDSLANAEQDH